MFDREVVREALGTGRAGARRWPFLGTGQLRLLVASLAIAIGSFLPWVDTAVGRFNGMSGPGVWTLYAAVLGLAGASLKRRSVVVVHAVVVAATAIVVPVWQLVRLARLCSWGACYPTTGLVVVLAAGVVAAIAAWQLRPDPRAG